MHTTRRNFIRDIGVSSAALPFLAGLPSVAGEERPPRQRIVFMFSPNGTVPKDFWPDATGGDFALKRILEPLAPFRDRMLTLKGVCNRVRGDGDRHMRGMSCLLTGIELFPGNIQGGSDTPAGWASGISIDQEIRGFLQSRDATRTRFGSLEFGVGVADRADPWTRMSYAGPNKPVAPVDNPYQMFEKIYGKVEHRAHLASVLDDVAEDLKRVRGKVSPEDRDLLEEHATFVRELEQEMKTPRDTDHAVPPIQLPGGVSDQNDNLPALCRMQSDLLVNALANDMARVATLQITKSVGQARMSWLGIGEGHHALSHDPDSKKDSQEKLVKINRWYAQQLHDLVKKLADTPEPGGDGSMLDHTTVVWANELGKGNNHTLNDIPFVMVGGGLGFKMGRAVKYEGGVAHNRLHLALAHAVGHRLATFGNKQLSEGGPLDLTS